MSLREMTSKLANRLPEKNLASLSVEEALAEKRIALINLGSAPSPSILRAVASIYGLAVQTDPQSSGLRLTRRRIRSVSRMEDLPAALAEAIPAPLLRAMHSKATEKADIDLRETDQLLTLTRQETLKYTAGNPARELPANLSSRIQTLSSLLSQRFEKRKSVLGKVNPLALCIAAVRCLRGTVEPVLKQNSTDTIPLKEVDTAGHRALAVILMTNVWPAIRNQLSEKMLPDYITRFDEMVLVGGREGFDVPSAPGSASKKKLSGFRIGFDRRNGSGVLMPGSIEITEFR